MSRQLSNHELREKIAGRFVKVFDDGLKLTPAEVSRRLQYANPSTVQAIRKGKALPDFTRLVAHRNDLRDRHGRAINLNWLLTGEGVPFLAEKSKSNNKEKSPIIDDIIIQVSKMTSCQRTALLKFLAEIG